MKKIYALLLAGVLTVSMVVPVFAANSPEADALKNSVTEVTTNVAGTSEVALNQDLAAEVVKVTSTATVLSDLGVSSSAKLTNAFDLTYSGTIPATGVQIPFTVTTASAGDYVYVLHRQSVAPYTWEVVGQGQLGSDLTVVGTFTSFSPVVIMVVDAANVTTAVTAPKTGEF